MMEKTKPVIFTSASDIDPWNKKPGDKLDLYINASYRFEPEPDNDPIDVKKLHKRISVGDEAGNFLRDVVDSALYGEPLDRSLLDLAWLDKEALELFISLTVFLVHTDDPSRTLNKIHKLDKRPHLYIIDPGPDDEEALFAAIDHLKDLN